MRNPLSAIIQCADVSARSRTCSVFTYQGVKGIISSHRAYESSMDSVLIPETVLEAGIDAAETIVQCAQHMKCIVDGKSLFFSSTAFKHLIMRNG